MTPRTQSSELPDEKKQTEGKIKILYVVNSCKRCGPVQQMLNLISYLDKAAIEPYLLTIYEENETSRLQEFLPLVEKHFFVKTSKLQILTATDRLLHKTIGEIGPDIIHSLGVFSDYAVSRLSETTHVITSRNYIYDDYPAAYGKVRGDILARMQLHAMRQAKTVCCSESLTHIYRQKLGLSFDYIRNGVEARDYYPAPSGEKFRVREKLGLPQEAFVFLYAGSFRRRKNVPFLLDVFSKRFKDEKVLLMLVGGGDEFDELREKYKEVKNIIFTGQVQNVRPYLWAADAYVSVSRSEGLPNGVLEAMATGLPFVLSDIEQHREIYMAEKNAGFIYKQDDAEDLQRKLEKMVQSPIGDMGKRAQICASETFGAERMSKEYQQLYLKLAENAIKGITG